MSECVVYRVKAGDKDMELFFDTDDVEQISTNSGVDPKDAAQMQVTFKTGKRALWREVAT